MAKQATHKKNQAEVKRDEFYKEMKSQGFTKKQVDDKLKSAGFNLIDLENRKGRKIAEKVVLKGEKVHGSTAVDAQSSELGMDEDIQGRKPVHEKKDFTHRMSG